jgi:hypothetical protein
MEETSASSSRLQNKWQLKDLQNFEQNSKEREK